MIALDLTRGDVVHVMVDVPCGAALVPAVNQDVDSANRCLLVVTGHGCAVRVMSCVPGKAS